MKTKAITTFTLILGFLFVSLIGNAQEEKKPVTILSGIDGGSYFQMATDIASQIDSIVVKPAQYEEIVPEADPNDPENVNAGEGKGTGEKKLVAPAEKEPGARVLPSDGAYYNFLKLERMDIDVAFMQYDIILFEELRDLKRKFSKTEDIRIVASLGVEHVHLITRKDNKKINSLDDLKGKSVGIGTSLSGTNVTANFIQEITGIKWKNVEVAFDKSIRALMAGEIDAFFFVGAAPIYDLDKLSPSLKDMIKLVPVQHKSLTEDKTKGAYDLTKSITAEHYPWFGQEIKTLAVKSVIVTSIGNEDAAKRERIQTFLNALGKYKSFQNDPERHGAWKDISTLKDDKIQWQYHDLVK